MTKVKKRSSGTSRQEVIIFDIGSDLRHEKISNYKGVLQASPGEDLLKLIGLKTNKVAVNVVQDNMRRFISNVMQIIDTTSNEIGSYKIESVEVNAEISGKGEIGFLGTNVGMSGSAGIKLVFKKERLMT